VANTFTDDTSVRLDYSVVPAKVDRDDTLLNYAAALTEAWIKVRGSALALDDLPNIIRTIYGALRDADGPRIDAAPAAPAVPPGEKPTAEQIRDSITDDALISFEDGKPYKMLRRHLGFVGLTPQAYRKKWGLPNDYPMTAVNYSATRSALAKSFGLGRK